MKDKYYEIYNREERGNWSQVTKGKIAILKDSIRKQESELHKSRLELERLQRDLILMGGSYEIL